MHWCLSAPAPREGGGGIASPQEDIPEKTVRYFFKTVFIFMVGTHPLRMVMWQQQQAQGVTFKFLLSLPIYIQVEGVWWIKIYVSVRRKKLNFLVRAPDLRNANGAGEGGAQAPFGSFGEPTGPPHQVWACGTSFLRSTGVPFFGRGAPRIRF